MYGKRAQVTSYVGAGGKTSSILEQMERCHQAGKRVVVTTTTHMGQPRIIPEGTDQLTETLELAEKRLKEGQVVWFGHPCSGEKFCTATQEEWMGLLKLADVILVEADGSRQLPVKVPKEQEPVIPVGTDRVIVLAGLHGLGEPVKKVCHRPERVIAILSQMAAGTAETGQFTGMKHRITGEDYVELLLWGYLLPLARAHPQMEQEVYLNQADTLARRETAARIRAEILRRTGGRVAVSVVNYTRALQKKTGEVRQ